MNITSAKLLVVHSGGSIYCVVGRSQRRINLQANGTIAGGSADEQVWHIHDDRLLISGVNGISCILKPDAETFFYGPLFADERTSAILAPTSYQPEKTTLRNDFQIRVFGQKRSGHHAVMGWLASQFGGGTYFFNDCIPFVDPLSHHINTSGFLNRYPGLVAHGLHGRMDDRVASNIPSPEAVRMEHVRQAHKPQLMVSFEDFDLECYEHHIVPSPYVGESRQIINLLILRDPFNHLASTIRFCGGDLAEQSYDHAVMLWKHYAREVLGMTSYLPNKICISYNKWFSSRNYRDEVASWFGLKNRDSGLNAVSPNGGGSSFDKSAYQGKAQAMPVLTRWAEFASDDRFLRLFADCELAEYANLLFREG